MKLSKAQTELLDAMKNGVILHWMPWMGRFGGGYYFRNDTMRSCTRTAQVLLRKGLVEIKDKKWNGHKLVYKRETSAEEGAL